jgi:hypothetical protein
MDFFQNTFVAASKQTQLKYFWFLMEDIYQDMLDVTLTTEMMNNIKIISNVHKECATASIVEP